MCFTTIYFQKTKLQNKCFLKLGKSFSEFNPKHSAYLSLDSDAQCKLIQTERQERISFTVPNQNQNGSMNCSTNFSCSGSISLTGSLTSSAGNLTINNGRISSSNSSGNNN